MRQVELAKDGNPNEIAISLGTHVPDVAALVQQGREFKSIVLDWFAQRGKAAREASLLVITTPNNFQPCLDFFEEIHKHDIDLDRVFQQVFFSLNVTDGVQNRALDFPRKGIGA